MQRVVTVPTNIENYQPLVKQIALQVASSIPRHVELDELISAGMVGLVESAKRFDPTRGVRFEAYVAERVRGSIIDFLRSLDWAPRSVRSAGKRIEEARSRLTSELGRQPSDAEVAHEMEMTLEEYRTILDSLTASVVLALDRNVSDGDDDENESVIAAVADSDIPSPEDVLERKELCGYLADAINCLPEQARTVIALYYIEGMHMAEIGELLGVTQSRASQIHSAALVLLKDAITAQLEPEQAPDLSNPRGRKAKRLARFFNSVAEASDWRTRLNVEEKTIALDFSRMVGELEERHEMTSDEFEARRKNGLVRESGDSRRWSLILEKSADIKARRAAKRAATF